MQAISLLLKPSLSRNRELGLKLSRGLPVPLPKNELREVRAHAVARLYGRSQDRFDLAARVDFRAPGGALHVRDRCHQVDRLSAKCHGVEKAHGAEAMLTLEAASWRSLMRWYSQPVTSS